MAKRAATPQKPLGCPQTTQTPAVDNLPSEAGEALQTPLEGTERASAGQGQDARLKREASGFEAGVIRDSEKARAMGRAGGLASAASRRKRKAMRDYLETALRMTDEATGESNAMASALALVKEAKQGNVRAWQAMLEALGEKAPQMLDVRSGDGSMTPAGRDLTALPIDQLMALARAEWGEEAGTAPAVEAQP